VFARRHTDIVRILDTLVAWASRRLSRRQTAEWCRWPAGADADLMRVDTYTAPSWPDGPQLHLMHLDVGVDNLPAAVSAAIALGATEAAQQPAPDNSRVLIDPAGHPFCVSTVRPD